MTLSKGGAEMKETLEEFISCEIAFFNFCKMRQGIIYKEWCKKTKCKDCPYYKLVELLYKERQRADKIVDEIENGGGYFG